MDKLKYIRIQQENNQYNGDIPIGVDSENVDLKNGYNLQQTLGDYDYTKYGNIKEKFDSINNDIASAVEDEANIRQSENETLNTQINVLKAAVGSPLVASTAAAMTDTDKIYVYTGNQSGYTYGHWYYWDGSAWADGGVYNETALETDKTLTVSNSAADAKVVGDNITELKNDFIKLAGADDLSGLSAENNRKYIDRNDEEQRNRYLSHTDYILIPENVVGVKIGNTTIVDGNPNHIYPNILFYDDNKTFLSYAENSHDDIAVYDIPDNAVYMRVNQPNVSIEGATSLIRFVYKTIVDFDVSVGIVGVYEGTFTAKQSKMTGIYLKPNTSYHIVTDTDITSVINIYRNGNVSNFRQLLAYKREAIFTNDSTEGELVIYNVSGYLGNISVTVYAFDSSAYLARNHGYYKYTVGKTNGAYDYKSVTQCLFDLKNDNRPKIIDIYEGDYDIYSEYKTLYDNGDLKIYSGNNPSLDFYDYCVWVPQNTHIIGKGIVRLKWMPDPNQVSITPNQCRCISPINAAGNCIIENVEAYCKNGRYCLHNDAMGLSQFRGATQKYINCRFYKYANDTDPDSGSTYGFNQTTGFGIDRDVHHVYENCTFINYHDNNAPAFYGHSRSEVISNETQSPDISLINCVFDTPYNQAVRFGNSTNNRSIHIRVLFNSCYFNGIVISRLEGSNTDDCANAFDLQFLNCGNVSVQINDPDNPYPPQAYNTEMTII